MKKNKFFTILFLSVFMTVTMTGCSLGKQLIGALNNDPNMEITMTEASHGIYQMNLEDTRIVKVPYEMNASTSEELIDGCIEALEQQPSDNTHKSIISGNVQVLSYEYDSTSRLVTLYFDPVYETMSASREILTRAGIVKTLTQFSDEIQYVSFVIGDDPLRESDGSLLLMQGRDFVINIGGNMEYVREDYVTMYFVNAEGTKLQTEDVIVKYSSKINLETAVVNSLISGPITDGLKPSLSADIEVNKVSVKEGICYVDLNETFLERVEGQSFQLNIYSIVNTLTHMPGITRVQFLIDGEIFDGTVEGIRIDGLFEKNMSLVYRPEKTTQSGTMTDQNTDLTKDIEKKVIEEQKSTDTGADETASETVDELQMGED